MNREMLHGLLNGKSENPAKQEYDLQAYHIKFETMDSEASDASYESSLSSNEDKNFDDVEYFREEMSRFFINYPELLNNELVTGGEKGENRSSWALFANNLLNEAKEDEVSLHGIAKRIAHYRQKAQETDIIDMIAKNKDLILRELEEEASMIVHENPVLNKNETQKRSNSLGGSPTDVYFSWKKKQQKRITDNSRRGSPHFHDRSKDKTISDPSSKLNTSMSKINRLHSLKPRDSHIKYPPQDQKGVPLDKRQARNGSQAYKKQTPSEHKTMTQISAQVKALLKFEPRTDTAKQLLEQIRRENPHDEITIKRVIVNFIAKYRENLEKEMFDKSSLPQRLSKLHLEDSKQLLFFCPMKKSNPAESDAPLNNETQQFLEILKEISGGHLMKYWRLLQQQKL